MAIPPDAQLEALSQAAAGDPARRVGRYVLISPLGQGAWGSVFCAWDPDVGRPVALKRLNVTSDRARARFVREARILGGLHHPAIPAVHDVGEHQGVPYIVMALVRGSPLPSEPCADPSAAALLIAEVARAVHAAHEAGCLHRDIKPANLLVDAAGRPHLLDFGLGTLKGHSSELTINGAAFGTPAYMAPEQATGDLEQVDRRSDVYGLGATLYELLVGRPPLQASSLAGMLQVILEEQPAPPRQLRSDLPPALEEVCLACLAKSPADRPGTALELAERLESAVRIEPGNGGGRPARALVAALVVGGLGGAVLLAGPWSVERGPSPPGTTPSTAAGTETRAPAVGPRLDQDLAALTRAEELLGSTAPWPEVQAACERARATTQDDAQLARLDMALGNAAALRGDLDVARAALERLTRRESPWTREALALRAAIAIARESPSDRHSALTALQAADPDGPDGAWADARLRLDSLDLTGARATSSRALQASSKHLMLQLLEAQLCAADGDLEPALQLARRACDIAPDAASAWVLRGRLALRAALDPADGQAEALSAASEASRLIGGAPSAEVLALLAELKLRTGDMPGARRDLDAALATGPRASALILRGLLRMSSDPEAAQEDWRGAAALDRFALRAAIAALPPPAREAAARATGLQSSLRGVPVSYTWLMPATLTALTARAARVPEPARADLLQALLAAARGAPYAAFGEALERARVAAPESAPLALEVARLLVGRDRYAAADDALTRAQSLASEAAPELERLLAEVQVRRGRLTQARDAYQAVAGPDPTGAEELTAAAEAALLLRENERALELTARALAKSPDLSAAHLTRALACRATGDSMGASLEVDAVLRAEGALNARAAIVRALLRAEEDLRADDAELAPALIDLRRVWEMTAGATPRVLVAQITLNGPPEGRQLARAALDEARRAEPERAEVHRLLGRLLLAEEASREQVIGAWQRALTLDPSTPIPPAWLAEARGRLGSGDDLESLAR